MTPAAGAGTETAVKTGVPAVVGAGAEPVAEAGMTRLRGTWA